MKNLENYGVQELSAKEVVSVDGGNVFIDWAIEHALDYAWENWELSDFGDSYVPGRYLP